MSSELRTQLNNIVEEKNSKIIPENIRAGVTIFDVEGTLVETDFSDITATASDVIQGVSAYGKDGEKIEGTYVPLDTSDATAVAGNLDKGVIAYTKDNERIVGTSIPLDSTAEPLTLPFVGKNNGGTGTVVNLTEYIPVVYETSSGGEFGNTILFPTSKLPVDITGKNIVLRVAPRSYYYESYAFCAELLIAPSMDNWFDVRRDSSRDLIRCWSADESTITNFQYYRITFSGDGHTIDEVTADGWEDRGLVSATAEHRTDNSWYRFSTKDMISKGGLGAGKPYQGRGDDCFIKTTLGSLFPVRKLKQGGVLINRVPNAEVAKAINLTSEKIVEGNKILGIEGTYKGLDTSDADATAADIAKDKIAYVNGEKVIGTIPTDDVINLAETITDNKSYAELEYITAGGNAFINTEVQATSTIGIELVVKCTDTIIAGAYLGAWENGTGILMGQHNYSEQGIGYYMAGAGSWVYSGVPRDTSKFHTFIYNPIDKIASVDGKEFDIEFNTGLAKSICLFQANDWAEIAGGVSISSCKIYDNNVLIKDYIPVIRKSDNVVCMYDLVNEEFALNAGSVDFTAGEQKYSNTFSGALDVILDEKEEKIVPENIRAGVTIFDVEGTYEGEEGLDTSDATATADDIAKDKTAYINGEKVTGTVSTSGLVGDPAKVQEIQTGSDLLKVINVRYNAPYSRIIRKDETIGMGVYWSDLSNAINLTADKIAEGETFLGITGTHNGLDTSDATATSKDIVEGKTAYADGQLVTGIVPSYDSTKPVELKGTYEVIDGTDPYFILTKQTPKGEIFNEILKFPSSAIDKSWIEDKSFALRVYYFSSTDYRIQLEVAPKGCRFQYSSSWTGTNNYDMAVIAYDSDNKLTPFTIYSCTTNDLNKLTTSSWTKEEKTDTSTYSNYFGGVNYIFAYSSDASIKNGSHNATDGIPAMGDKIVIKDTINSIENGVHINNNTELYTKIPQSAIATHIGLTSSMIAKGQSVLGVSGSLEVLDTSDANATAADIIKDKTAYVNGEKITGTAILGVDISDATISEGDVAEGKLAYSSAGRITGTLPNITDILEYENINITDDSTNSRLDLTITNETDRIVRKDVTMHSTIGYSRLASLVGLTPEKLVRGNTVLGIEGTQALGYDTSDATAVAGDIVNGKTAYINGGIVTGTLTAVTGSLTVSESDVTLTDNSSGKYLGLKHQLTEKAIYDTGSTLNYQVGYSRLAQIFGVTGDKIVKGNTILGVEGTVLTGNDYPQLYTSIEAMNADTTRPDGTFAIVYGTTYDGTFICSSGVWEQIGQPTETVETYNSLSLVDESEATYYEGMGATEEEIVTVLDEVLGNEEEV